jgi:glutamine synthetase
MLWQELHTSTISIFYSMKSHSRCKRKRKAQQLSLATDTGENLLSPGKNPKKNLQFLTFFVNTLKAVHDYADLLRASIASASNDHRLGANEAPPAIISAFIGSQLFSVFEELEK